MKPKLAIMGAHRKDYIIKDEKPIRLLGISVVKKMTGLSAREIGTAVRYRTFPAPIKVSATSKVWVETEVLKWIEDNSKN